MSIIDQLKGYHLDILKEVGNIGSGNAATSLSKLLDHKVDMKVPSVRLVSFDETMEMVGGPDEIIVAVFLRLLGDAPGSMFFVLSPEQAEQFVHEITGSDDFSFEKQPFDEMGLSVLHEVGNILAGSYLSALSDFTNMNIQPSVPALNIDMAGAVLTQGLMELSRESDYAIVVDTTINDHNDEQQTIQGHFLLLPDPESFSILFNALGVNDL